MPSKRREYVSRANRDGHGGPRKTRVQEPDRASFCFRNGAKAAQEGVPRYANPYTETKAKSWTLAWNVSHVLGKRDGCTGCKLCLVGTSPATEHDLEVYDRLINMKGA